MMQRIWKRMNRLTARLLTNFLSRFSTDSFDRSSFLVLKAMAAQFSLGIRRQIWSQAQGWILALPRGCCLSGFRQIT